MQDSQSENVVGFLRCSPDRFLMLSDEPIERRKAFGGDPQRGLWFLVRNKRLQEYTVDMGNLHSMMKSVPIQSFD